jgi:hypothetical protein
LVAAIITSCSDSNGDHPVLEALADAAAAAQAAGCPLPLRTLRVLGPGPHLSTAGRLLAGLPHLHTLQLGLEVTCNDKAWGDLGALVQEALAPLGQATQLQQLYLERTVRYIPRTSNFSASIAGLLPASLKRLTWKAPGVGHTLPGMSHLTQVTFLQLHRWPDSATADPSVLTTAWLPSSLQQLELLQVKDLPEVLEEQPQLVTGWQADRAADLQRELDRLSSMRSALVCVDQLQAPAVRTALAQHPHLSKLELVDVCVAPECVIAALGTAASIKNLRSLGLSLDSFSMIEAAALSALTRVTRLSASVEFGEDAGPQRALADGIGRMTGLRWLSVSVGVLQAGWAWLGGLQQLQVMHVYWIAASGSTLFQWLEGHQQGPGLPPQLQLLAFSGMTAEQAAAWQLRRRLQGLLGSTGCEVVVGPDLEEVCDPAQQLAGLPLALQQALEA